MPPRRLRKTGSEVGCARWRCEQFYDLKKITQASYLVTSWATVRLVPPRQSPPVAATKQGTQLCSNRTCLSTRLSS